MCNCDCSDNSKLISDPPPNHEVPPPTRDERPGSSDLNSISQEDTINPSSKHKKGGRKARSKAAISAQTQTQPRDQSRTPWSQRSGRLRPDYLDEEEDVVASQQELDKKSEEVEGESKWEATDSERLPTEENQSVEVEVAENDGETHGNIEVEFLSDKEGEKKVRKEKRFKNSRRPQPRRDAPGIASRRNRSGGNRERDETKSEGESEGEELEFEPKVGSSRREGKEDKKKPLSIRLDLNLELEIFLKAKVKGDITITFLQ